MITPSDDFPHPVPPQAFMIWRENWVFPAVDTANRTSSLFHFSLRPSQGEGIFTAKFCIDGDERRYVGRSPVPKDLTELVPVRNDRVTFEVLEPGQRFRCTYTGDDLDADITYTARFAPFDFSDGPMAPGESVLGDLGRHVFPFHHYEQSLWHEGRLSVKSGKRAGETIEVSGYANRDHSWGWRDDLTFRRHHWICASFDDRYLQGTMFDETHYPAGPKFGGWFSTAGGNDPVSHVDTSEAYWQEPGQPLPVIDRDVRYRLRTVGGQQATVVAHVSGDYGRLYLNARSPDRTQIYQDVQIFCDFTLTDTGQRGSGVLEVGKFVQGEGTADRFSRTASRG